MTCRANRAWYALLIGLGLPVFARSSSEPVPEGEGRASVFTENVTLGSSLSVGASKRVTRSIIPITGGTVTGRYVLGSNEGELLIVRNCGPFGALIPLFEAKADGPYAFLDENEFVSSDPGAGGGGVSMTFYERL